MSDTFTTCADDAVMAHMEAVNKARILLTSDSHRSDLTEMASITNDMLAMKARYDELQAAIDRRNQVYTNAEEALGAYLAQKHVRAAPEPQSLPAATTEAPAPSLPGWPNVEPDILDGSVLEEGGKRYVATNGAWVEG